MVFPRVFVAGAVIGLVLGGAAVWLASGGSDAGSRMRAQGAGGAAGFSRGAMAPAVTTAAVEDATIGRTIDAVGSGRAVKSVTLVSEATGLVEDVAPRAGEAVRAGDVILKLDDSEQKIAVARTRAQYPIAKANWDSFAALFKDESASRLEADTAFNQYKAAEADLKSAEFALQQRTIRAPFDGVVGLTDIEAGDYVRAGDIVTTIDDLSSLIIEFAVPQEEAADVKIGQPVTATLAGGSGKRMEGAVSAIDSRVDLASRTLRIEATFENHGGALIPGATYAVSTTNAGAAALSVPGLAVQWDRTGAFVWKIEPDGAAARVGVTVLQRRDEAALVAGDLAGGDTVIVEGADRIRPGMSFPAPGVSASGVASVSAGMQ